MAGIGFEIKKILRHQTFFSEFTAYLYAATVSSGPWLMSILTLALLGIYRGPRLHASQELFRATVIYAYAFSLIFVGIVQLVATRYLADRYYEKDTRATLPAFSTCAILVLGPGAISSSLCFSLFQVSILHKLCAVILFLVVSMIWLNMIFLSAIKDYASIVIAFSLGSAISVFAAVFLGRFMDTEGYLLGYIIGQSVIMFWLLARLLAEFPAAGIWDPNLKSNFIKYWDLMLIGFMYNLAIWIDKFVFWIAGDSRVIVPWYKTHDLYDAPVFWAYLTVMPTLALFLVKIETRFYEHYQRYFAKIIGKQDLAGILSEKEQMTVGLKDNLREIMILQGTITVACIVYAPDLVKMANLVPLQIPLFRVCLIGAFLNVLLSVGIIVLFYFDSRRSVLCVVALFLALNAGFSFLTTRLGIQFYGYGYAYACLISLMLAFYLLHVKLENLEYFTFARQRIQ